MRHSIRSRIAWTYFLLIFAALLISGVYTVTITRLNHQNTLRLSLESQARLTSAWVAPLLNPADGQVVRDAIGQTLTGASLSSSLQVAVFDKARNELYNSADQKAAGVSSDPEVADALNTGAGESTRSAPGGSDMYLYVAVPIYSDHTVIGVCRVGESLTPIEDELYLLWQRLAEGFLVIALAAGALGVYFARRVAWPIEEITRVAQLIAEGRLTERIRYHRKDELGEMSDSINLMASRMSEQIVDLTEQQSKLYGVLAHMESGVLLVDRASKITLVNQYAESMLQADTQTILNKWHWEALHSYRLSSLIDEVVLKGQPLRRELTLLASGERGVERVQEVYETPIVGHLGAIGGAVIVLHDISEYKRLARMRSEFVANVSHELRTPITAVKGFAETLLDGASSDPALTNQFLTIIHEESERMTRIVS
ncbi:MAG: cell wall metabolism sensor histidine kinase WalK, partial [Bacilli bacterium]|nr:cell wall metabolism sensor histidine kinase WalK [Bacilli bacterium]